MVSVAVTREASLDAVYHRHWLMPDTSWSLAFCCLDSKYGREKTSGKHPMAEKRLPMSPLRRATMRPSAGTGKQQSQTPLEIARQQREQHSRTYI